MFYYHIYVISFFFRKIDFLIFILRALVPVLHKPNERCGAKVLYETFIKEIEKKYFNVEMKEVSYKAIRANTLL